MMNVADLAAGDALYSGQDDGKTARRSRPLAINRVVHQGTLE
jgi:hypothetical protein